jgi:pimeloyl-ACP methyl ester carboxylesterase
VIGPLRALGHDVQAIDLPGRGESANLAGQVTLDDWIECVAEAVDAATEPPVLVAHSQGGVSSSAFAERRPGDVRSIVYINAVVPVDGASGLETFQEAGDDSILLAEGSIVFSGDGATAHVPPVKARDAFYNCCDDAEAEAAVARLCPESVQPLVTPLALGTGFASVPKTYIGARQDRVVPPALQRTLADRCGAQFVAIDSDHSPFLSATDTLVTLLAEQG